MYKKFLLDLYLLGYEGRLAPRAIRRLLARTQMHRAWLSGYMGVFREERQHFGCLGRAGMRSRAAT